MVSEFIEEKDGYLALSDEQYELEVTNNDQDIEKSALAVLEIGEHQEGYWNSDRFMEQVGKAVRITDLKYPPSQGYHRFDHSCGHTAYAEDASKMNKGPGGKQPKMRETVWNGQQQTMTLPDGRPKGAALVLEGRGYNTKRMKLEEMRARLQDTFLSNSSH